MRSRHLSCAQLAQMKVVFLYLISCALIFLSIPNNLLIHHFAFSGATMDRSPQSLDLKIESQSPVQHQEVC